MSKKVVVISTSLRANSNSEALAREFVKGAEAVGHEVEYISLKGKSIAFCIGCLACQSKGHCIFNDDALPITEAVLNADVVVWATPIYYYEMAGQMKVLIDRMNSMFPKDYKFREVYFLATAADNGSYTPERALAGLTGWIDCFEKAKLAGSLFCGGVNAAGEISGSSKLQEAYELGLHAQPLTLNDSKKADALRKCEASAFSYCKLIYPTFLSHL